MPPGVYGLQGIWEDGGQQVDMDFLLPTGIYLNFAVSRNDTIRTIKKVTILATVLTNCTESMLNSVS